MTILVTHPRIDLGNDPAESNNLAAGHPERVSSLLEKLVAFRKLRPAGGVPPMVEPEPRGWNPLPDWEPVEQGRPLRGQFVRA